MIDAKHWIFGSRETDDLYDDFSGGRAIHLGAFVGREVQDGRDDLQHFDFLGGRRREVAGQQVLQQQPVAISQMPRLVFFVVSVSVSGWLPTVVNVGFGWVKLWTFPFQEILNGFIEKN